jgi:hypothetical protein
VRIASKVDGASPKLTPLTQHVSPHRTKHAPPPMPCTTPSRDTLRAGTPGVTLQRTCAQSCPRQPSPKARVSSPERAGSRGTPALGFGVWGLGLGILGFVVGCLVFGVWCLVFGVWGSGLRVDEDLGFRVRGSGGCRGLSLNPRAMERERGWRRGALAPWEDPKSREAVNFVEG